MSSSNICDSCMEDSCTTMQLCQSKSCAQLCSQCITQYLETELSGFAVCVNLKCPGSCNETIPMSIWSQHATNNTNDRYKKMLLARLSIRCPGCHNTRQFAGHAKMMGGIVLKNPVKTPVKPPDVVRYERKMMAFGCKLDSPGPPPPKKWASSLQRMVEEHDLSSAIELTKIFISERGESKQPLGDSLGEFVQEAHENFSCKGDMEKFAALFNSFVQLHPHITSACCNKKICFQCQTSGWHESTGGSCQQYHEASGGVDILPCPRCKCQLVKSEGCAEVTCPMCQYNFTWGSKGFQTTHVANIPPNGTIRSGYVRTSAGWEAIPPTPPSMPPAPPPPPPPPPLPPALQVLR